MKGRIEWIRVSAVVHSTEDREKVGEAMATLFPFEFEIAVTKARGHFGNPLEYLEVELTKSREIEEFWRHLMQLLGEQRKELVATMEDRIDSQNVLHIRIDKQRAYLGEVRLAEKGDAIAIKAKLVAYPARREKIVEFAKQLCTTS
ncbi:MAG: RNA-binding domain-containing protein [Archaeoglobaceae archaeon]